MNEQQKAEIERLAGIVHAKQQRWRWLGMCNTPTDPDAARQQTVEYRLAETEWLVAESDLWRAQAQLTQ
jgi:hypothetical protein